MDDLNGELEAMTGALASAVEFEDARQLSDETLLKAVGALERLGRVLASRQVALAAEVDDRSRRELGTDGLAAKKGCRTAEELLERVTLASGATIARRVKVGRGTRGRV